MLKTKLKICYQNVPTKYKLTPSPRLYPSWLLQALRNPFFSKHLTYFGANASFIYALQNLKNVTVFEFSGVREKKHWVKTGYSREHYNTNV